MKPKTLTIRQQRRTRRRVLRRRVCVPVLCPVCGQNVCDCQLRPIRVAPLSVHLSYDLPY